MKHSFADRSCCTQSRAGHVLPRIDIAPTRLANVSRVGCALPVDALRRVAAAFLCLILAFALCIPAVSLTAKPAYADNDGNLVIVLDPGHGGSDPGAVGVNNLRESDTNWAIAVACRDELNTYAGVTVILSRSQNETIAVSDRVDRALAADADMFVSLHCNSYTSSTANGAEVWVPNTSPFNYNETRVPGYALGSKILDKLVSLGFRDRDVEVRNSADGTKYPDGSVADYYTAIYRSRLSGTPGIIVEHGFVTNPDDAAKLRDASWRTKMGVADATAIAEYYGLSKKSAGGTSSGSTVVTGSDVHKVGEAVATEHGYDYDPTIMGATKLSSSLNADTAKQESVAKMVNWFNSKGKTFPEVYKTKGASSITAFCTILYEEAVAEGVRPEVAFAQAMKETGWLGFGGQVKAEQCNFCGLGALDGGAAGADFSTYGENGVRMGLRAQVQHLKAYGSTEALKNDCVDPRFHLVTRGKAPTVQGLSGTWASDKNYGTSLASMISELLGDEYKSVSVKVGVSDSGLTAGSTSTVYVDGKAQEMKVNSDGTASIDLSGDGTKSVVVYEYNTPDTSDVHKMYPTGMQTWLVSEKNGSYVAQRYYGLEDLLIYSGCSIRVTGTKGIRMITGMSVEVKNALTTQGINGYKLVETGTLLAWSSNVGVEGPTLSTSGVSRGRAYVAGSKNPVLSTSGGVEYYTNVLTGNFTADQCKADLAMRPYVILKNDAGDEVVVYGGTVHRSIGYIAEQNAGAFPAGSAAYNYVHSIINSVR